MTVRYLGNSIYKGLSEDTKPPTAINTAVFVETNTNKIYLYDSGTTTWNQIVGAGGGGGGGAAVVNKGGLIQFNGTASQTVFNIPHTLGVLPTSVAVAPASVDALGDYVVTKDTTNIIVTYQEAPPSGVNNVKFEWGAVG